MFKAFINPKEGHKYSFIFKHVYRTPEYDGLLFTGVYGMEVNKSLAFSKIKGIQFNEYQNGKR